MIVSKINNNGEVEILVLKKVRMIMTSRYTSPLIVRQRP